MDAEATLAQTGWTQPALFAIEYALAELWQSWGIRPSVVLGHSVGEYVAACVAGVFSLEQALTLIAERARLMEQLPAAGVMIAVPLGEAPIARAVADAGAAVSIAAVNGPDQTVISGTAEGVAAVLEELGAAAAGAQPLKVSHAFHSALVDPMLDAFERAAARVTYAPPRIPVVSNVTGLVVEGRDTLDAPYRRRHTRATVRFADALETARAMGCRVLLEVGPQSVLATLAGRTEHRSGALCLASLRRRGDDWQQILSALAAMHVAGVPVDWAGFDRQAPRRKLRIPTYPFQHERHWIALPPRASGAPAGRDRVHPLLGVRLSSPRLQELVFERELDAGSISSIAQHRIFDRTVVPAAAYLEMALAAGHQQTGAGSLDVREFVIREALMLDDTPRTVQTIVVPGDDGEVQIVSRRSGTIADEAWTIHATGRLHRGATTPVHSTGTPVLPSDATTPTDADGYYARLRQAGVDYGPAFRGLGDPAG